MTSLRLSKAPKGQKYLFKSLRILSLSVRLEQRDVSLVQRLDLLLFLLLLGVVAATHVLAQVVFAHLGSTKDPQILTEEQTMSSTLLSSARL